MNCAIGAFLLNGAFLMIEENICSARSVDGTISIPRNFNLRPARNAFAIRTCRVTDFSNSGVSG